MKPTCFQLLSPENKIMRTYTTAQAAAKALVHSPAGYVLEAFFGNASHGIIDRDNPASMKRFWAIVAEEIYP